jgi:hypothetical protein
VSQIRDPDDSGWVSHSSAPHGAGEDVVTARPGGGLLYADQIGTTAFVTAAMPAATSQDWARFVLAPLALLLAGIGIVLFLWSYFTAVQRSRRDEIAVTQLYFVSSGVASRPVRLTLNLLLWVQIVVGITVMAIGFARASADEANWSAFAIVVPLFGFGINGMWVSRHGTFRPRILTPRSSGQSVPPSPEHPDDQAGMEQDPANG